MGLPCRNLFPCILLQFLQGLSINMLIVARNLKIASTFMQFFSLFLNIYKLFHAFYRMEQIILIQTKPCLACM